MNPSSLENQSGHGAAVSAKTLAADLIAHCPVGARFDAGAAISEHPELTNYRSALLDLAYEEYGRCHDLGIPVEPVDFAARFPTISRSLLHQIEVHHLIADGPEASGATKDAAWPVPGDAWLDFQLLEELGWGVFSRVYLAREKSLGDRLVVVKATSLGPREAHTLGMLQHPQIVPVHSVQRDEQLGLNALCMPFLSRASLFDVMDTLFAAPAPPREAAAMLAAVRLLNAVDGTVPEVAAEPLWPQGWSHAEAVASIGAQVAQALGHAHEQGVVHGDVKPSNVLVTDGGRAFLLDFNLAMFGDESGPFITGTLPYMSPEQLRPLVVRGTSFRQNLDERSDVFGLGITLFELLYGRAPFGPLPDENSRELVAGRLLDRQRQGPILPDAKTAFVDPAIQDVILRCLAFDRAQRPQSMAELAHLFADQLRPAQRLRRWLRRNRRLTIAASILAGTGVLSLGTWQANRDPYPFRESRAGELAYNEQRYADAVQHFSNALRTSPDMPEAQLRRGLAYFQLRQSRFAHEDLETLLTDDSDGHVKIAIAHVFAELDHDYSGAGALYERAISEGYMTALVENNWGLCLHRIAKLPEAAIEYENAIKLDPQIGAAYLNRAILDFELAVGGRRDADTTSIDRALARNPKTAELYLHAALAYAICSRAAKDDEELLKFVDQIGEFVTEGRTLGLRPSDLDKIAELNPNLQQTARWRALVELPPSSVPFSRARRMLDPFPELLAKRPIPGRR